MSNKKQNEELQSRREFFKKAAKAALPVVGAVVLSSVPFVKAEAVTGGCENNCYSGCYTGCHQGCKSGCTLNCEGYTWTSPRGCNGCTNACYGCQGECRGTCKNSCAGNAYGRYY